MSRVFSRSFYMNRSNHMHLSRQSLFAAASEDEFNTVGLAHGRPIGNLADRTQIGQSVWRG
jgi:hypothetical protein